MITLTALVAGSGCRPATQQTPRSPEQAMVMINAYVNVSSGCQQETMAVLEDLAATNPTVKLTVIDFGDGGEGARKWQESGHTCMTIEINGSPFVKYPGPEGDTISAFLMPPGFQWTLDELRVAVVAAVEGKLQTVTEEEALAVEEPKTIKAEVVVKAAGEDAAVVMLEGKPIMRLAAPEGDQSAAQRAEAAAATLKEWLSGPVQPSEIQMKAIKEEAQILVAEKVVVTVTAADAKAAGSRPRALGKEWVTALRQAVVAAAAGAGEAKAEPDKN
jgi:hypothetical protein